MRFVSWRISVAASATLLAVCVPASSPQALTIEHDPSPSTLQATLNATSPGDTVLLLPGTHLEQGIDVPWALIVLGKTTDPAAVVVQGDGSASVFRVEDIDGAVEFGFLTITGGDAFGGGGVEFENSEGTFRGVVFVGNTACQGGGLSVRPSSVVTIENCEFRDNVGRCSGGGVFLYAGVGPGDVSATIIETNFIGNRSDGEDAHQTGGGIYANDVSLLVDKCHFEGNRSSVRGGGALLAGNHPIVVRGSVFRGNEGYRGGGVSVVGDLPASELSDCRFEENHAVQGGGASVEQSPFFTVTSTFSRNVAEEAGGGLYVLSADPTVAGSLFLANEAPRGGGLLYDSGVLGALERCTFWGNSADVGGAICTEDRGILADRSIVAFNAGGGAASGIVGFSCSTLFGNVGGDWSGFLGADRATTFENFSLDPSFCDVESDLFTLRSDSPCAAPGFTGCGLVGALPVGCGSVSVESATWGSVKGWYR